MFPTISTLSSLDVYRDGGSLSVSFKDDRGVEHTLMFPINLGIGYFSPALEQHKKIGIVSPVTGITNNHWDTTSEPLTWAQAREILNVLSPLVEGFVTDYAWVFPAMRKVAENEGVKNDEHA